MMMRFLEYMSGDYMLIDPHWCVLTEELLLDNFHRCKSVGQVVVPVEVLPWQGEDHEVFDRCLDWCAANEIDVTRDADRMAVILSERGAA